MKIRSFMGSVVSALLALLLSTLLASCWARTTSVHVVFGNHLDIGFDNIEPLIGYDNNVLNKYFNEYLPRAAAIAKHMEALSPDGDRYIYTTHSYLISLFLDCPLGMGLNCPNSTTTAAVLDAIKSGAITWHAHPHNAQYEFYDSSLLEFSFDLTHDLDRRFGFPPKHTAILRDVPGLTRAVIPIFVSQGIKAISVGVNAGSAPPGVPKYTPFIWRDEASDTHILAFWHPGGYGGMRGDLALDPREECIQAPGLKHMLCTSWRNDDSGPPETVLEPLQIFKLLRQDWAPPTNSNSSRTTTSSSKNSSSSSSSSADTDTADDNEAHVIASSFDAFVDEVLAVLPSLNLPVVTDEIGDTWVFGVQSDPLKTANFRAASRLRAACIADPACPSDTPEFYNFSRLLLKVPEHTWGVDIKKTLHDFEDYSNTRLHACLPPHLRPHWAPGYTSSNSGSSSSGSSSSSSSRNDDVLDISAHTSTTASSELHDRQDGSGDTHGGGSGGTVHLDADSKAPCPNYGHCIKAWNRQAAYIDWALQALPQDHWVVQAYAADLKARQQLAAVNPQQLMHSDSALLPWPQQKPALQQHLSGKGQKSLPVQSQGMEEVQSEGSRVLGTPAVAVAKQRRLQLWQQQQRARIHEHARAENTALPTAQEKPAQPPTASSTAGSSAHKDSIGDTTPDSSDAQPAAPGSQSARLHTREVAVTGAAMHQHRCGSWRFELDEALGGLTSLVKYHGDGSTAGTDWARGSSSSSSGDGDGGGSSNRKRAGVLCQLVYSAYCEASYDDVWDHYAWHKPLPWWLPLDFGKVNSSHAWDREEHVVARLVGIFETSTAHGLQQLSLKYSLPHRLVRQVGAPETLWTIISCPASGAAASIHSCSSRGGSSSSGGDGDALHVSIVWQNKTPTRIPEALWFSFRPAHTAVDLRSWRLHKLGSSIHPHEVMLNGSRSMHAVSDEGVSVTSSADDEVLQIKAWDTALVSPGHPTPFPQGRKRPDLKEGVHVNLANNVWGTNYVMWIPYSTEDRNLAFRFTLQARRKSAV